MTSKKKREKIITELITNECHVHLKIKKFSFISRVYDIIRSHAKLTFLELNKYKFRRMFSFSKTNQECELMH
jgi:hypothetical protein